jgi:hypothetical protein
MFPSERYIPDAYPHTPDVTSWMRFAKTIHFLSQKRATYASAKTVARGLYREKSNAIEQTFLGEAGRSIRRVTERRDTAEKAELACAALLQQSFRGASPLVSEAYPSSHQNDLLTGVDVVALVTTENDPDQVLRAATIDVTTSMDMTVSKAERNISFLEEAVRSANQHAYIELHPDFQTEENALGGVHMCGRILCASHAPTICYIPRDLLSQDAKESTLRAAQELIGLQMGIQARLLTLYLAKLLGAPRAVLAQKTVQAVHEWLIRYTSRDIPETQYDTVEVLLSYITLYQSMEESLLGRPLRDLYATLLSSPGHTQAWNTLHAQLVPHEPIINLMADGAQLIVETTQEKTGIF